MMALAPCLLCRQPFMFNPDRVPSTSVVTGHREPICRNCIGRINATRKELGSPPFEVHPDAYEPQEVDG